MIRGFPLPALSGLLLGLCALVVGLGIASPRAMAQDDGDWRTVSPERLWIIDTSKGRIIVELFPDVAPRHVERVSILSGQGFYDGHRFHRVISGFMAQTGDPMGTGAGGSALPNLDAELNFRRGQDSGFVAIDSSGPGLRGLMRGLPITTQPDAQMMVTADFKVGANALFCPGVVGMARANPLNSANSQFYLMMGRADRLNGLYTPFGRIVVGLDVVQALKAGPEADDGAVRDNPDTMVRVRIAAALPEAERPVVRVLRDDSPQAVALVAEARAARGDSFDICDVYLPGRVDPR